MPILSDSPLQKVTLNIYEADHLALQKLYGQGWSVKVRQVIHDHVIKQATRLKTLEQLINAK